MTKHHRNAALAAALLIACGSAAAATPTALPLYVAKPLAGARVMVGDADVQNALAGASSRMDSDPKAPATVVEASRTRRNAPADALRLAWKNAGSATVRIESAPLDLRQYMDKGTVSFDLKVNELAHGGLAFRLQCGADCERKIPYVVPAQAAQGKGWKHLRFAMHCFYREGDDFSAVTTPFALDASGGGDVEIANIRIDAAGTPNATCPDYRTASVTPQPLAEWWSIPWWIPRHEEKLAEIARRKAAGETTGLVFIGDSITHNWESQNAALWKEFYGRYNPLNLGYGGDRTENVLWRLQHGEIDGVDPKVVVMMLGTNNTGHRHDAPETTLAGVRRNIAEVQQRLPDAKILLLAIFPRGEGPADANRRLNDRINPLLAQLADDRKVFFLDMKRAFLAQDGTLSKDIMPDLLHPNADGYRIWQREMQPTLDRLMQ
jgi:lysophospholipase L1-like esterase